jgi:hypothetical protein
VLRAAEAGLGARGLNTEGHSTGPRPLPLPACALHDRLLGLRSSEVGGARVGVGVGVGVGGAGGRCLLVAWCVLLLVACCLLQLAYATAWWLALAPVICYLLLLVVAAAAPSASNQRQRLRGCHCLCHLLGVWGAHRPNYARAAQTQNPKTHHLVLHQRVFLWASYMAGQGIDEVWWLVANGFG